MWKTVKLGDVCEVLDKLRKPITKKDRISGEYPYYGATGVVDWVHDYIFDEKLVLVGEDGAKWGSGDATAFIATGKYWVNNHAHVLRPKPDLALHEWISYYLTGIDLNEFVTGLTVPKLNQSQLNLIPIPLPPLAEQRRIVAKLDAAFAEIDEAIGIAETKQAEIENLKSTLLSLFLNDDAVMWKTVKLGDVCEVLDKLRKPITKKDRISGEYPYYGATGVVDWVHDYIFDEKLVLVGEDGAKWGSGDATAFIATGKYWVNNHAHVLRPKPDLALHEWISYYLTGIDLNEFVTGLTVPKLNQSQLNLIPIPLPPLADQQRIVAKLDAAFAKMEVARVAIAKSKQNYQALKSSILTQELQQEVAV